MQRVASLPLVRAVSHAYSAAKDWHPLLGSACRLAEHCVCGLTTCALHHAQPLLDHLQPQRESPRRPWVLGTALLPHAPSPLWSIFRDWSPELDVPSWPG